MLVDPGKLTLNFDPSLFSEQGVEDRFYCQHAEGVVLVTLTAKPPSKTTSEQKGSHQPLLLLL